MIERVDQPFDDVAAYPDEAPASIEVDEASGHVLLRHRRFVAEIDPRANHARLWCADADDALARDLTQRTMLSATLPLDGGMLVHGAGIVVDGRAILFVGPSGAGKSTLASFMDVPLLSDELVAVQHRRARASGFWGTLDTVEAIEGEFPLHAVVALGRGEKLTLAPLAPQAALRMLVNVAVVPPLSILWRGTLNVLNEIITTTPVLRMTWTPSHDAARRLVEHFSI